MKYLAFIFVLFLTNPVYAGDCHTLEQVKVDIRNQLPETTFTNLGQIGTKLFLAKFDLLPPITKIEADTMLIANQPNAPRVVVVFFLNDCEVTYAFPERNAFNAILGNQL